MGVSEDKKDVGFGHLVFRISRAGCGETFRLIFGYYITYSNGMKDAAYGLVPLLP